MLSSSLPLSCVPNPHLLLKFILESRALQPRTCKPTTSASRVAVITGICHHTRLTRIYNLVCHGYPFVKVK
ncbi:rCG37130, partial [Rattus norvegicus]